MRRPAYLAHRKGVHYFRARVPTKLVEAYGRAIVFVSLGTGNLELAKARLAEQVAAFCRELARLQKLEPRGAGGLTGPVLHLTGAEIERLCSRFKAEPLASDELDRGKGLTAQQHKLDLDVFEHGVAFLPGQSSVGRVGQSSIGADNPDGLPAVRGT